MATDEVPKYLCIPASSLPYNRRFSKAGELVNQSELTMWSSFVKLQQELYLILFCVLNIFYILEIRNELAQRFYSLCSDIFVLILVRNVLKVFLVSQSAYLLMPFYKFFLLPSV